MAVEVAPPGSFEKLGLYDLESRAYSTRHLVINDLDEISIRHQGNAVAGLELSEEFNLLSAHLAGLLLLTGTRQEAYARTHAVVNGMKLGILVGQKLVHDDQLMLSLEPITSRSHHPADLARSVRHVSRDYLTARTNLGVLVERYTGGYTTTPAEYADAVTSSSYILMLADCHLQTTFMDSLLDQDLTTQLEKWSSGEE